MKRLALILMFILSSFVAPAQRPVPERGSVTGYQEETRQRQLDILFSTLSGAENGYPDLINGKEFFPYYYRSKSKPLLFNGQGYTAGICVNGRDYNNISLVYDTYTSALIYNDTTRSVIPNDIQLVLNNNIVETFYFARGLDTIKFLNISPGSNSGNQFLSGYYEKALKDSDVFFIKHRSVVYEKNGTDEYYYRPVILARSGNEYITLRSASRFVRYFGEKGDEVKKQLQKGNRDFNPLNREKVLKLIRDYSEYITEK